MVYDLFMFLLRKFVAGLEAHWCSLCYSFGLKAISFDILINFKLTFCEFQVVSVSKPNRLERMQMLNIS